MKDSPLGPVPHAWKTARLIDLTTKIGSGATPLGGANVYLAARQQWSLVRSQNVFDRAFDDGELASISDDAAKRLRGVELRPGDVLLNITGDGVTFGRACIVPPRVLPAVVNQHVAIIRADQSCLTAGYLLAYLTHPQIKPYIASFNTGASRRAVTKGAIESFIVPLPPVAIQHRIADILGAYDDLIENNRRRIATLEATAQTAFASRFGSPTTVDDLATDRGTLSDLAKLERSGIEPKRSPETTFEYLSFEAYDNGQQPTMTKGSEIQSNKFKLDDGVVLVPKLNPHIPRVWFPKLSGTTQAVCSTEFLVLRPTKRTSAEFLFAMFSSPVFLASIAGRADGTSNSHKRLKPDDFLARPVRLPNTDEVAAFTKLAAPIYQLIHRFRQANVNLGATRDLLLPRLMSGEIDVRAAEAAVP